MDDNYEALEGTLFLRADGNAGSEVERTVWRRYFNFFLYATRGGS